ncbi:MAG: hypothetical protein RMX65_016820 [Nostoc sp. DedQUE01]|nr:hypothetical protein [Nostoc sp. DedQUE01]
MEATRFCEVGKKGAMPAGGVAIAHRKCPYFRLTVIILNFARSLPQLQSISQGEITQCDRSIVIYNQIFSK